MIDKLLYWCMVLAAIGLVCSISASPQTRESEPIVTGTSASQHARDVDLSDAQAVRRLRSKDVKETIHGANEERAFLSPATYISGESVAGRVQQAVDNLEINSRVNQQRTIDHFFAMFNPNTEFSEWLTSNKKLTATEFVPAMITKTSELISGFDERTLRFMLRGGMDTPRLNKVAEYVQLGVILKWTNEERVVDALSLLMASETDINMFLKSLSLRVWIYHMKATLKKNPYVPLLEELLEHYSFKALAEALRVAKDDVGTEKLAVRLQKAQLEKARLDVWSTKHLDGVAVFDRLGLIELRTKMIESTLWDMWVAHMTKLNPGIDIARPLFSVLRQKLGNKGMADLLAAAKTVEKTKELAAKWENVIRMSKLHVPQQRAVRGNADSESVTKRQRRQGPTDDRQ